MSDRRHSPRQPEMSSAQLRPAQRSCTLPWPALAAAALLVLIQATCCLACSLHDAASLNACLKRILEQNRDTLKSQIDPLRLPDASGKGVLAWNLTGISVWGLSKYDIKQLSIEHKELGQLTINFKVSWPRVTITSAGRMRLCTVILGGRQCFPFKASPQMWLDQPTARLFTRLRITRRGDHLSVKPSGTRIQFKLPRIIVHLRLKGFIGLLDSLLRYPSRKIATRLARRWWGNNKRIVEDELRDKLVKVTNQHLSSDLGAVLQGM